jgi:hypothetical protein
LVFGGWQLAVGPTGRITVCFQNHRDGFPQVRARLFQSVGGGGWRWRFG